MKLASTSAAGAVEILEDCAFTLGEKDHPLLRYAAGSAAMELALRPCKGGVSSAYGTFERRQELLRFAKPHYLLAAMGLSEMSKGAKYALQLAGMEVQALHTVAYMPLAEIAASWQARHKLDSDSIDALHNKTRTALAHLGEFVLGINSGDAIRSGVRTGLMSELACGMVGQVDEPSHYLLLPGSLRQDHNRRHGLRADLIAMSAQTPHRKTLLQVKHALKRSRPSLASDTAQPKAQTCVIEAQRDLVLHPDWNVERTIESFIKTVEGTADSEITQRFAVVGRVMTGIIDNSQAMLHGKKPRKQPLLEH